MISEKDLVAITPPYKFGCPDDWVYKDMPRVHPKLFQQLIDTIGDENFKLLSYAEYPCNNDVGMSCRGQMMVSPSGIQNLKDFYEKLKAGAV